MDPARFPAGVLAMMRRVVTIRAIEEIAYRSMLYVLGQVQEVAPTPKLRLGLSLVMILDEAAKFW